MPQLPPHHQMRVHSQGPPVPQTSRLPMQPQLWTLRSVPISV